MYTFSAKPGNNLVKKIIMTFMGKEIVRYEITLPASQVMKFQSTHKI